jgi:hypothetical protein
MKSISLKGILESILLNESVVSPSEIVNVINQKRGVIIDYDDETETPVLGKRYVEIYVYGLMKGSGNEALRGFAYAGVTKYGLNKWKTFLVNRIRSWEVTDSYFNTEPNDRNTLAQLYNRRGDGSMTTIFAQVKFDNDVNNINNPDRLERERLKTDRLRKSTPVNINQLSNDEEETTPQEPENKFDSDKFKQMLARNLDITRKEKEKRGFSLGNNQESKPVDSNNTEDVQNKMDQEADEKERKEQEFKQMLARNLKITDDEKKRRGFDINK